MKNKELIEVMKDILDQTLREELHNLKKEIIISNSRVDLLEAKLGIAYDELTRSKENFTKIVNWN